MNGMAAGLSKEGMQNLSDYFAKLEGGCILRSKYIEDIGLGGSISCL
jgi:hypothetical protein